MSSKLEKNQVAYICLFDNISLLCFINKILFYF